MARSKRLARGAAWLAILVIAALAMAGPAAAAPPPYPDTSAVGTVPAMSQKLVVAKASLDKVEAQIAALRQKSDALTRVQMAPISDVGRVTTLVERPVDESLIWYPTLHGDELWFSTIHPSSDPSAEGPEYNLEMLDLTDPGAGSVRFLGTGHDFNPAVNDDDIVWKANRRGDSALNWGTLKVLDRRDQKVRTIPVENANRPSIGDRFVAFDEISRTHLSVYDPVTRTVLHLASGSKLGLEGDLAFGGESVSGRLLAFSVGPAEASAPPRIGWAILPE